MKVVCESCQAKYQVPDERVAGKKLKIKCKRCGATVLIRGDLAVGAAGAVGVAAQSAILPPASVPPTAATETAPLEWHVSRDGETRGPFDTEELRTWLSSEPGGWDVHVWRDGFPDWIDARSCAELGGPLVSEARATFDPHEDDGPTRTFESAMNAGPMMARAAASTRSTHASTPAATHASSFASDGRSSSIRTRSPSGISNGGGRISTVEPFAAERHEDSALFSARGLPSVVSNSPSYAPGPNPGFASGEGSGLIDIRALASLARQTTPRIAAGAVAAAALHANPNGSAARSGGYAVPNNGLSYGDDEGARGASMNQGALGRVDSLAPVSTGPQTSNVAVPLAIVGGCALVAAAVFAAMLIARPAHPPEPVAVSAPAVQDSDSLGAVAQPPSNPEPAEPSEPPAAAAADEQAHPAEAAQEPSSANTAAQPTAADESGELASGKPKHQLHVPRTVADDKKSGAPSEEKAKPKKEEKSESHSTDEVMLADKAKPKPAASAPEPKPEAAKPSGGTATDIDQLLAAKPAKQPAKSRSLDDLLEGADKDKNPSKAAAPAAAAAAPAVAGNDDDSGLPDAPSRDEILAAMHGVEPSVRACAIGQQVTGTAEAAITISGSSGRVTTANVAGITGNVGSCIARAVRGAKFSRFKKPNFSIKYPYRF